MAFTSDPTELSEHCIPDGRYEARSRMTSMGRQCQFAAGHSGRSAATATAASYC
jgi:hypothetical protein